MDTIELLERARKELNKMASEEAYSVSREIDAKIAELTILDTNALSWIVVAADRIKAGEPEIEVMADYGYIYQKRS